MCQLQPYIVRNDVIGGRLLSNATVLQLLQLTATAQTPPARPPVCLSVCLQAHPADYHNVAPAGASQPQRWALTGLLLFDIIIRQASSTNRLRRPAHIGTGRELIEAGE